MTTAPPASATAAGAATATLTRVLLNRNHPAVRRDLADATELHKTVMRLVPDNLGPHPRQHTGLLFRLETDTPSPSLLVQTRLPPHPNRLPTGYGITQTRNLAPMLRALTPGLDVRYRITANASKRDQHSRKAIPLQGEDALAWWYRRATQAGLHVHHADTDRRHFLRYRRQPGQPYHALTRFEGTATVTDPETLAHAVLTGIGKGKAYGAGLLSLLPAHT